jgi:hypothetical protein
MLDRDACRLPTRPISEFDCPSILYNFKIGELIQMNALPDDITMLQAQLESLEARSRAHDLLLAAIAAHLQALIAVPGFLASAFDSAAMTANSLMMSNRSDASISAQTVQHIEQLRGTFNPRSPDHCRSSN